MTVRYKSNNTLVFVIMIKLSCHTVSENNSAMCLDRYSRFIHGILLLEASIRKMSLNNQLKYITCHEPDKNPCFPLNFQNTSV